MLTKITLDNFKSYRQAHLPLAPLTVLIGANASGKSNAIEAMRLLSWLAQGHKLSTIKSGVQDSDQILRGRIGDLGYQGARTRGQVLHSSTARLQRTRGHAHGVRSCIPALPD